MRDIVIMFSVFVVWLFGIWVGVWVAPVLRRKYPKLWPWPKVRNPDAS